MQITVKVEEHTLFQSLKEAVAVAHRPLPLTFKHELIDWQLVEAMDDPTADDLLCSPDAPSVLLMEADDTKLTSRIQAMQKSGAIFQLRLKLDMITKSQVALVSAYKKGYCLSHKPLGNALSASMH